MARNKIQNVPASKKLKQMERQVHENHQQVEAALRTKKAGERLRVCQATNPTPRPAGSVGKKSFNLQRSMGLSNNKPKYNKIKRDVIELAKMNGIVLSQTFKAQSKLKIAFITNMAMQEIPYLAKFRDGWPVECILMQYLKNHVGYKRQKDHELAELESSNHDESETDAENREDSESQEDHDEVNSEIYDGYKSNGASQHGSTVRRPQHRSISGGINQRSTIQNSTLMNGKTKEKGERLQKGPPHLRTDIPNSRSEPNANSEKQGHRKPAKSQHMQGRREGHLRSIQVVHRDSEVPRDQTPFAWNSPPRQRLRPWTPFPVHPSVMAQSSTRGEDRSPSYGSPDIGPILSGLEAIPDELEDKQPWHPGLGVCPNQDLCSDPLPQTVDQSTELRHSIDRYSSLLAKKDKFEQKRQKTSADQTTLRLLEVEASRLELVICSKISNVLELGGVRATAEENGWPTTIDFLALARVAWSLEAALCDLFANPLKRHSDIVWVAFLNRVKKLFGPGRLDKFAAATPVDLGNYNFTPVVYTGYYGWKGYHVLQQTLMMMFGAVGQMNSIKPLSLLQFNEQLLIPFVAIHAISQELSTSIEDALDIL